MPWKCHIYNINACILYFCIVFWNAFFMISLQENLLRNHLRHFLYFVSIIVFQTRVFPFSIIVQVRLVALILWRTLHCKMFLSWMWMWTASQQQLSFQRAESYFWISYSLWKESTCWLITEGLRQKITQQVFYYPKQNCTGAALKCTKTAWIVCIGNIGELFELINIFCRLCFIAFCFSSENETYAGAIWLIVL